MVILSTCSLSADISRRRSLTVKLRLQRLHRTTGRIVVFVLYPELKCYLSEDIGMTKKVLGTPTLVGIPFDGQSSYLRGAGDAPPKIREAMSCHASNLWTELGVDLGAPGVFEDAGDLSALKNRRLPSVVAQTHLSKLKVRSAISSMRANVRFHWAAIIRLRFRS